MRYSLLFLFLAACVQDHAIFVEPDLRPYVDQYEKDSGTKVVGVTIRFGEIPNEKHVGICYKTIDPFGGAKREIVIRKEYFDKITENQRMVLIYHELGHCYLNRGHLDEKISEGQFKGMPKSIMYFKNFGYPEEMDGIYKNELFPWTAGSGVKKASDNKELGQDHGDCVVEL